MKKKLALAISTTALVLGAVLASACSSDSEEAAPSRPPVPPVTTEDGSVTDGGGSDVDAAACTGPEGCFSCEPVAELEFLNACTDGTCTPFDNAARLPLYKAGQPLPAIP